MIIYPINGRNERMGSLFHTPKHLLKYEGRTVIERSIEYMKSITDDSVPTIIAGDSWIDELRHVAGTDCFVMPVGPTANVVQTIKQSGIKLKGDLWIVDCDILPMDLPAPGWRTTVYCFRNDKNLKHYSNFKVGETGQVLMCNEKEEAYEYAGAGVYYFKDADEFWNYSGNGEETIAQIMEHMVREKRDPVFANTDNLILRLGTLPDITGGFTGNVIERKVTKRGRNVANERLWYLNYHDKADIPALYAGDAMELTMEYIDRDGEIDLLEVYRMIQKYKNYSRINRLEFDTYRERIASHLILNEGIVNGEKLLALLQKMTVTASFSHGDLSITNVIPTKKGMILIDPLYSIDTFGSYVLDYAKFLFSLKFYGNDHEGYNQFMNLVNYPGIELLIASEAVRVATYNKQFNFIAENLIEEL